MTQEKSIQTINIAQGHSHVGVQAGMIEVSGAAGQADLQDQLAELRRDLLAALRCNELDAETFSAADEELSKVEQCSADGSAGRGKLVISLKRLKGLVDGIADLGAKVAVIIAAVHGL